MKLNKTLSPSFRGSGIWELSRVILAAVTVSAGAAFTWSSDWSWRITSRWFVHRPGKIVPGQQVGFGGSWPRGPIHRATWLFSWYCSCHLSEQAVQERPREKSQCILWCSLKIRSFLQYPFGYTGHPYSVWEGTTERLKSLGPSWRPTTTLSYRITLTVKWDYSREASEIPVWVVCF